MTITATRVDDLREQMKAALTVARDLAAKAEEENRDFTTEERSEIQAKMKQASDLRDQLKKAQADEQVKAAIAELGDSIGLAESGEKQQAPGGLWTPPQGKSLGEHYVTGPEFKGLMSGAPGGRVPENSRVNTPPTWYKSILPPHRGQKALVTGLSDTSGGAFVQNDNRGLQVGLELFQRPLRLRDLVTNGSTTSDTIEFVRVTGVTNNAAPVAEATATSGSSGTKPESGLATARVTETVRTIAHWIPITKRALSDAAQMRTLIDNFLIYGLEEELEDQMVAGDGTGENLMGIANVSGVQAQGWETDFFHTTHKALTKVRTVGRSVSTGWLLNPADIETMDLLQDNNGQFYYGGPAAGGGVPTLWRVPVIESEAVPAGTGYVGDWRKCVLYDREQASITTSDSHESFFTRNMVAVLAELRAAFICLQPSAFVEVDLTA